MKDIFISYRRKGGEHMALLMYHQLRQDGYTVFLDVESLHKGKFDEAIYTRIQEATDFLLILSPNALDRCKDSKDWVRQEIECAIKNQKNIIPIMMEGFEVFPNDLPETMSYIATCNGPKYHQGYFTDMIRKLEKNYLESTPQNTSSLPRQMLDDNEELTNKCTTCGSKEIVCSDPLPKDISILRIILKTINWWFWLTPVVFVLSILISGTKDQNISVMGISLDFIYDLPLIQMLEFGPETLLYCLVFMISLLLIGNTAYKYSYTQPILEKEYKSRNVAVTCKRCSARRNVLVRAEDLPNQRDEYTEKTENSIALILILAVSAAVIMSLNVMQKIGITFKSSDAFMLIELHLMILALVMLHRVTKISHYLTSIPTRTFNEYLKTNIFPPPYEEDDDPTEPDYQNFYDKVVQFAKPDQKINKKKEEENNYEQQN